MNNLYENLWDDNYGDDVLPIGSDSNSMMMMIMMDHV